MFSGGSDVFCSFEKCLPFLSAEHWEQAAVKLSMALFISKAKKNRFFIWFALGRDICKWIEVTSPCSTDLRNMRSSFAGTNGSFRLATSNPSDTMVATLRWRLMSFIFVALRVGRVRGEVTRMSSLSLGTVWLTMQISWWMVTLWSYPWCLTQR